MKKYAFMVSASGYYAPGLKALLHSINEFGKGIDIVAFVSPDVDDSKVIDWNEYHSGRELTWIISEGTNDKVEMVVDRFKKFAEIGKEYDAICILDADMYLTADVCLFFDIADAGFIVSGSNGMLIDFNSEYQKIAGVELGRSTWPYPQVHTTVPLFLSPKDLDWLKSVYDAWTPDGLDDFLLLNILGMLMNKHERMLVMPPYAFTGIHHWQMKPETAVFEKANLLLSGTEEQVYMVHGKWWDQKWLDGLWETMERYFQDEGMGARSKRKTQDAIYLLKSKFEYYLNGGKNDR